MTVLFKEPINDLPLFEDAEIQSKFVFQNDIIQSKDKWFL